MAPLSSFDAALFGALQGLTEFLPISSSGHLAILGHFLALDPQSLLFLTVWVHAATLVAVLAWYWRDLYALAYDLVDDGAVERPRPRGVDESAIDGAHDAGPPFARGRTLLVSLIVGTIPAVVVGLLGHDAVARLDAMPRAVAGFLLVTGVVVLLSAVARDGRRELTWRIALVIGVAQAIAIVPGISRSGMTIVAGLVAGLRRAEAVRFSFLLSIPVIAGAALLELRHGLPRGMGGVPLALAAVCALATGLAAIGAVRVLTQRGKLWMFGVYCLVAGTAGVAFIR